MRDLIVILTVSLVVGCQSAPKYSEGIPMEEWPEFIPLSQIEKYVGMPYDTPSLGQIFGGLPNLKLTKEATSVVLCTPDYRLPSEGEEFITMGGPSGPTIGRHSIGYQSEPIDSADLNALKRLLLDYDSYGDRTLCVFHTDLGFILQDESDVVHVLFCYSCEEVYILKPDSFDSRPRSASPELLSLVKEIASKHLPPEAELSVAYKKWKL